MSVQAAYLECFTLMLYFALFRFDITFYYLFQSINKGVSIEIGIITKSCT